MRTEVREGRCARPAEPATGDFHHGLLSHWRLFGAGSALLTPAPSLWTVGTVQRLIEYFGRSYVINLVSRVDRRVEMERELASVGVAFEPGRVELFPAVRPEGPGEFPSLGARGCFTSHIEIIRRCLSEGAERVLIMEDDLAIDPRLREIDGSIVEQLQREQWGIVYLGHYAADLPVTSDPLVRSDAFTHCSHFYGVSAEMLPVLGAYLEAVLSRPAGHPEGGPMHYDGALTMFRERHPGTTLFTSPNLGQQRSSRSDIAPEKWFDKVPGVRALATQLKRFVR